MANFDDIEYLIFYGLLIINFLSILYFIKNVSLRSIWINPLTIIILFYLFNYPIRGLMLLYGNRNIHYNFDVSEINIALTYSTVFYILILYGFFHLFKEKDFNDVKLKIKLILKREDFSICHSAFLLVFASYFYYFYTGKIYSLYSEVDDLYSDFLTNFIGSFKSIGWFVVVYGIMIWITSKKKLFLIEAMSVFLLIFLSAFISTSKGSMVGLALALFFVYSVFNRKPPIILLLGLFSLFICYSIYSYIIRYYGTVRGTFDVYDLIKNLELATEYINDTDVIVNLGGNSSIDRVAYLDGLILCIRKGFFNIEKDYYIFGGISELANLIPRFIWIDRPFLNYNIFLTSEIWGNKGLVSETPIGRIGESFFVLGYLGVIYGLFYGFLFRFIQNKFVHNDIFLMAMYFFILHNFIMPDAFMFYNIKPIIFGFVIIYILKFIVKS